MIELTLQKELMLIVQTNQKSAKNFLNFLNQSCVCNRCYDLLMMSMNLSDIAILNIVGADYCCIISGISKSEAIKLIQNIDLTRKSGTL